MRLSTTGFSLAALLLAAASGSARADDVHCPPNLGAVTIDGNVLISAPCRLDGTIVKGNVHLYTGGSLVARDARIDGNIQAQRADFVDVAASFIGGSIQLDEMVGDLIVIDDNRIDGSIQLVKNRSRQEVTGNVVGADVQAFENSGGIGIADNEVDGNLQCKSNSPAPTGGNNIVHGNKEDQCAALTGSATGRSGIADAQLPSGTAAAVSPVEAQGGGGAFDLLTLLLAGALAPIAARRR